MRLSMHYASALASGLFFMACSTVPDEAPKEYHLAKAALDRAGDADVENTFPETMKRAEYELKEAVDIYKTAKDRDVEGDKRAALIQSGTEKANKSLSLTEKAITLNEQVKAWDNRIELKDQEERTAEELRVLRTRVATLDQQGRQMQASQQSDASKQSDQGFRANIKSPVVFFHTNETNISGAYRDNLISLAQTLKANPELQVTLLGYADSRGNRMVNERLSQRRAEQVARFLKMHGVQGAQIQIEAMGASDAMASSGNPAAMQLDRRVDAFIVNRSGAETVTGR